MDTATLALTGRLATTNKPFSKMFPQASNRANHLLRAGILSQAKKAKKAAQRNSSRSGGTKGRDGPAPARPKVFRKSSIAGKAQAAPRAKKAKRVTWRVPPADVKVYEKEAPYSGTDTEEQSDTEAAPSTAK
jgi:hypothetical protein